MYLGCVSNVYLGCIQGCILGAYLVYLLVYQDVSRVQPGVYPGEGSTGWLRASTLLQEIEGPGYVRYTTDTQYLLLWIHPRYITDTPQINLRKIWLRVQIGWPMATSPLQESKVWALVYPSWIRGVSRVYPGCIRGVTHGVLWTYLGFIWCIWATKF